MTTAHDDLNRPFEPDWVVPPGGTIKDAMDEQGMSITFFSLRMGWSKEAVGELLCGDRPIDPATAFLLESILGGTARFWLNLERNYQTDLGRLKLKRGSGG